MDNLQDWLPISVAVPWLIMAIVSGIWKNSSGFWASLIISNIWMAVGYLS